MAATVFDPELQPPAPADAGAMVVFSTDAVPPAQRADYWHEAVLRRLDAKRRHVATKPFHACLTRLAGAEMELLQHSGDALVAQRDARRCRKDGYDDIVIDFVVGTTRAGLIHAGTQPLHAGSMVVVDCAQPVDINRAKHRVISLFLRRAQVEAVFGDPALLAGRHLPAHGLSALLRVHMLTAMEQAADLLPAQRLMAVGAAGDMALSILQTQATGRLNPEDFATGTYHAAMTLIARDCTNPELTPQHVALALSCSRAALYRVFAKEGESVAATIWAARLAHATTMLGSTACADLLISEIAFRSGFADHSTFDRMFKRRLGMTPGEMRHIKRLSGFEGA
jgi:AraC-like DNA-binding protein